MGRPNRCGHRRRYERVRPHRSEMEEREMRMPFGHHHRHHHDHPRAFGPRGGRNRRAHIHTNTPMQAAIAVPLSFLSLCPSTPTRKGMEEESSRLNGWMEAMEADAAIGLPYRRRSRSRSWLKVGERRKHDRVPACLHCLSLPVCPPRLPQFHPLSSISSSWSSTYPTSLRRSELSQTLRKERAKEVRRLSVR